MNAPNLIMSLNERDIDVRLGNDGRLVIQPASLLTDDDRVAIREHAADIKHRLAANDEPPGLGEHSGHSATKLDMSSRATNDEPSATTIITGNHVAGSDGTSCVFRTSEGAVEYARRVGGGDPSGQAFSRATAFEDALQALVACGWSGESAVGVARAIADGVTDETVLTAMLEVTQ